MQSSGLYEASLWTKLMEVIELQLIYSDPKRWCCESSALNMPANLENLAVATGLGTVCFHSNPKEGQCQRIFKLPHNCTHLTHYQVMLKILQVRLQQYMSRELPDIQAGFRKGRRTRDQIANICWTIEKAREFQKNICTGLQWVILKMQYCFQR